MNDYTKTRRDFLKFLGYGSLSLTSIGLIPSCSGVKIDSSMFPSTKDDLILAPGLKYDLVISWGDKMNAKEEFGFNNDYINIHPLASDKLIMWVNHEYTHPLFVSGLERTKKNIDKERRATGGSLIQVDNKNGKWTFNPESEFNRGVRSDTMIPFANGVKVKGKAIVEGTLSNCAGGKTPWGTFLTCEENYHKHYGERERKTGKINFKGAERIAWYKYYPNNLPEHYGWVTEIEPKTGKAQKHTNLGRFAHESSTCIISKSKKVVVYSGDDKADEHVYKFVSKTDKDFKEGTLFVADTKSGKWLPLDLERSPVLKKHFKTQLDVVTYPREAAKILGATPLNRPEDIEIHPHTGDVFIALTNNKKKGDFFGSILKISETNGDHSAETFKAETFLFGGEKVGMSCPDNMAFDHNGNLYISTDISTRQIAKGVYKPFGNNGLFVVPSAGPHAGDVVQIASCPKDAEFTGLCFDPEQKQLFVSVQHPGETTKDLANPTSNWPTGKMPKPSVVAISGSLLEQLTR